MRWVKFPDGCMYTFASDIQNFAEREGYKAPREADGTRHPGTDCNAKMRTIFKSAGMRRTFNLTEQSVVDVRKADGGYNEAFVQWLVDKEIISDAYLKHPAIQLYSIEAVNALLSVMLNHFAEYVCDDCDYLWYSPIFVSKISHNFEKKRNRPKASLFKR